MVLHGYLENNLKNISQKDDTYTIFVFIRWSIFIGVIIILISC